MIPRQLLVAAALKFRCDFHHCVRTRARARRVTKIARDHWESEWASVGRGRRREDIRQAGGGSSSGCGGGADGGGGGGGGRSGGGGGGGGVGGGGGGGGGSGSGGGSDGGGNGHGEGGGRRGESAARVVFLAREMVEEELGAEGRENGRARVHVRRDATRREIRGMWIESIVAGGIRERKKKDIC